MLEGIRILRIVEDTMVDGPGFRTAIYGAGCPHGCAGCHNPDSWRAEGGRLMGFDEVMGAVCAAEFSDVTFSGGDPMMQPEAFTELARRIKAVTTKNIWCYSGFTFEQIAASRRMSAILPYIDVLVDGRFVESLRDESLRFAGSRNQRLIDVPRTLESGRIVLWGEFKSFTEEIFSADRRGSAAV